MGFVRHSVRAQGLEQCVAHLPSGRDAGERHRVSGREQPVQMEVEIRHPAAVHAQPLPDRISTLHDRVEHRHLRLGSRDQASTDMDENAGVAGVRELHRSDSEDTDAAVLRPAHPNGKRCTRMLCRPAPQERKAHVRRGP